MVVFVVIFVVVFDFDVLDDFLFDVLFEDCAFVGAGVSNTTESFTSKLKNVALFCNFLKWLVSAHNAKDVASLLLFPLPVENPPSFC